MSKVGFSASASAVAGALERVGKAGPRSFSIEALRSVLITAEPTGITFQSTDMSFALRERLEVKRPRSGECIVDLQRLLKGVKTLEGDLRFDETKDRFTVRNGSTALNYPLGKVEDYPTLIPFIDELSEGIVVGVKQLTAALATIEDAISKDESRPMLTGVELSEEDKKLRVAATDSYRLASDSCPIVGGKDGEFITMVVKGSDLLKALSVLTKDAGTWKISRVRFRQLVEQVGEDLRARWLVMDAGDRSAALRLIDGQYPKWRELVPENWEGSAALQTKEAVKAFRRMEKLAAGRVASICADGESKILARQDQPDAMLIESKLEARFFDAPELMPAIGINPGYFADALEAVGKEEVRLHWLNPLRPLLVTEPDSFLFQGPPKRFHLVMPIRLAG